MEPDTAVAPERPGDPLIGPAELRNHFDGRWAGGYEVVSVVPGPDGRRYRVVRSSDGTPLPVAIPPSDIRRSLGSGT